MTLEEAIEAAQAKMTEDPELANIVRGVRAQAMTPEEGAQAILGDSGNEDFVQAVEALANQVSTALVCDQEARSQALEQWGLTEEDLLFQPDPDRPTVMLNPLYQALIVEVLQFDGDLPELRTGPLPEGGTPAVPVQTDTRNPIMLGLMLKEASAHVHKRLKAQDQKIRTAIEETITTGALAPQDRAAEVRRLVNLPASIPEYGPGKQAQPLVVARPSISEMTALSFGEKQEMFHKALTSTQGRRSAAPTIAALVTQKFHDEGFLSATVADTTPSTDSDCQTEWTISIDGWKSEYNPRFSYMDNAASSLARSALEKIRGKASRFTKIDLHVRPINTVSESRVGWGLSVFIR